MELRLVEDTRNKTGLLHTVVVRAITQRLKILVSLIYEMKLLPFPWTGGYQKSSGANLRRKATFPVNLSGQPAHSHA